MSAGSTRQFSMASMRHSALRKGALKVRCLVRAARAFVLGDLGIGAQRAGTVDLAAGAVRGDDLLGRDALLHPALECRVDVRVRAAAGWASLAEDVRSRAGAAVLDSRSEKESYAGL